MNAGLIFVTTFLAIMKIIIVALAGFVMAKRGIFHKQLTKDLGKLVFQLMIPCMIFGNIINNVNTDDYKMVAILFFSPIITHLIAFTLGQIGRTILGFKSEEEDYLLVVAGSTFGNHGNLAVPLVGVILGDPNGPFKDVQDAYGKGSAYVMVYMSTCAVIMWGVGMPWFRRRNLQKLAAEARAKAEEKGDQEMVELAPPPQVPANQEKKVEHMSLLKMEDAEETDGGEHRPDGPPSESKRYDAAADVIRNYVIRAKTAIQKFRKSSAFELMTLPPVMALSAGLFASFVPPLRYFLKETYAQLIPDTASFIGDASIPMILMILGSNLADRSKEAHVPKKIIFSVMFTRLILLPTVGVPLVYGLAKLGLLPDDIILHFLLMIQFSMPSAVNLIVACQVAGGGEAKMSSLLFWQYVACAFTISTCCIIVQFILL